MRQKSTVQLATIVMMINICQPIQAQARDVTSVNQVKTEIKQLHSDVEELKGNNERLSTNVTNLQGDLRKNERFSTNVTNLQGDLGKQAGTLAFIFGAYGGSCAPV